MGSVKGYVQYSICGKIRGESAMYFWRILTIFLGVNTNLGVERYQRGLNPQPPGKLSTGYVEKPHIEKSSKCTCYRIFTVGGGRSHPLDIWGVVWDDLKRIQARKNSGIDSRVHHFSIYVMQFYVCSQVVLELFLLSSRDWQVKDGGLKWLRITIGLSLLDFFSIYKYHVKWIQLEWIKCILYSSYSGLHLQILGFRCIKNWKYITVITKCPQIYEVTPLYLLLFLCVLYLGYKFSIFEIIGTSIYQQYMWKCITFKFQLTIYIPFKSICLIWSVWCRIYRIEWIYVYHSSKMDHSSQTMVRFNKTIILNMYFNIFLNKILRITIIKNTSYILLNFIYTFYGLIRDLAVHQAEWIIKPFIRLCIFAVYQLFLVR